MTFLPVDINLNLSLSLYLSQNDCITYKLLFFLFAFSWHFFYSKYFCYYVLCSYLCWYLVLGYDDELFFRNGWLTKDVHPCLQPGPFSEVLTITNVRHASSKYVVFLKNKVQRFHHETKEFWKNIFFTINFLFWEPDVMSKHCFVLRNCTRAY